MIRRCARPGCLRPAEATLSYSYTERIAWIDDLAPEGHPMVHDLCSEHAASLRVPVNWVRRDRRSSRSAADLHERLSA